MCEIKQFETIQTLQSNNNKHILKSQSETMAMDKFSNDPNPNQNRNPNQKKFQWCELVDEDNGKDLDFLLPPRQVIGPDERGVKKVVEYKFDDEGNEVKKTTTTRVQKLAKTQLSKRAMERRAWPKFGDAVHDDVGARLTMVSTEDIFLERPRPHGSSSLPVCV